MRASARVLPVLVIAVAGCASVPSVADRAFAAGDYPAAAAAYEEALRTDPRARRDAQLCLHLGIAYAAPGSLAHDPARAVAVLKDVAARFPGKAAGAQAALLIPQLEHETRLVADLAAATAQVGALESELARMREEDRDLAATAKASGEQLGRARAALAEKEAQLRRVRDELEQLKRIDLQRTP